jgi:hypothetical protein
MDNKCNKQCSECTLQCIVKTAAYIVVGGNKIIIAQGDKKP